MINKHGEWFLFGENVRGLFVMNRDSKIKCQKKEKKNNKNTCGINDL